MTLYPTLSSSGFNELPKSIDQKQRNGNDGRNARSLSVARPVSTDVNFVGPTCLCQVAMELFFRSRFQNNKFARFGSLAPPASVQHGDPRTSYVCAA